MRKLTIPHQSKFIAQQVLRIVMDDRNLDRSSLRNDDIQADGTGQQRYRTISTNGLLLASYDGETYCHKMLIGSNFQNPLIGFNGAQDPKMMTIWTCCDPMMTMMDWLEIYRLLP